MFWDLVFVRDSKNKLNVDINEKILKKFTGLIEKQKSYGFKVDLQLDGLKNPKTTNGGWRTLVKFKVSEDIAKTPDLAEKRWEKIYEIVKRRAGEREWLVRNESDVNFDEKGEFETQEIINGPFIIPDLTDKVMEEKFEAVYEREPHIRLIHDTVKTFNSSNREIRGHTLLYGQPAGCKTTLYEKFKVWYEGGDGVERVKFLDATTMSKAGLENWLISAADDGMLPDILVLEEIEKQSPDNLLCLLSVMGSGYVAKHNAKIQARKQCNCLIWATCNDEFAVRNFRAGALWSRFAHKWYCHRPTKTVMEKILRQKVKVIGGNPDWVDKVMDLAYNKLKETDPRTIISYLDGGDRLMDGSYVADILSIAESKNLELRGLEPKVVSETDPKTGEKDGVGNEN